MIDKLWPRVTDYKATEDSDGQRYITIYFIVHSIERQIPI